jgi:hypothetical protein
MFTDVYLSAPVLAGKVDREGRGGGRYFSTNFDL